MNPYYWLVLQNSQVIQQIYRKIMGNICRNGSTLHLNIRIPPAASKCYLGPESRTAER
ncbi:hypothetical protein OIU79_011406 [Salix purpurea]|uniref:Uncharacterized protein n=1 Tax=Salix purpurea TaxID=77065 RepID=A0A9Q0Q0N4_SALPP|nr:hypothetical protein OIU79_011406 [Salix purpurea]